MDSCPESGHGLNKPDSKPQQVEKEKREAVYGACHPVAHPFGARSTLMRGQLHLFYFFVRRGELIVENNHGDVTAVAMPNVVR